MENTTNTATSTRPRSDTTIYGVGKEFYAIPDSEKEDFLKEYSDACVPYFVGEAEYKIPVQKVDAFTAAYPAARMMSAEEAANIDYRAQQKKLAQVGAAERKRLARQPKEEQSTLQAAQDTTIDMTDVELGRMVIENAQQNGGNVDIVKQLTDLSEKVTEELNAAGYTYSQSEKKTSFAQRLNQSEMGSNSIIDYPDRINNKDGSTSDYKDAVAANRLANQALARITNVEKAEKKSKVGATFQGIKDAAMDPETWMMGLTDLVDIQRLYKVAQKYENGIGLSQSEEDLLEAAALNMTAEMDYNNRAYNLGVGVGESLAYMAEFSINPMATAGPAIAKGMGKTLLKTITKKALSQIGRKAIKIGCRAIGDVVAASAMSTMPTQIARVASDAYQRKMGEIKIDVDDDGLIRYKGVEGGENTWWGAAVKAYGANTIENWSEMFGNYLSFGKLGKGVKPADLKGVKKFLYNLDTGYWSRAMKQYLDRANWHGTAGEFVEEIVNNLANSAIIGDMSWNPNSENYIWNKDTLVDTFLSVAIFGGFASTFQTGLYIGGRAKLNSDHKKRYADGLLQFADNWEDMSAGIDNVVDEAIATDDVSPLRDMLKNVAADPDMSAREKTVYARYVTNALQRKGNEEMLEKAMEESAFMKNIHEAHKQNISRLQKMDQKDLDMEMRNAFLQYHETAAQMDEGELDMTVQEIEDYIAEHPEREDIINEYIAARNTMDAYRELAEAGYHAEQVRYNEEIENQTNSDGNVYYAQDLQGNNIVIVDGTLILHDDGTIDIEQSKNIVAVGEDGQRRMIAISDIRDDTPIIMSDPEELKANKRREIKEAIDNMAYAAMMTRTDEEILSDASEQLGQKVMMNIGGEVVEAEPIQITPEGEVVVQFNRPGGKTISAMSAEMWDASVIKSVKKQPAATEAETEAQEAAQPSQGTQAEAKQALPLDKNGNADYDALLDMDADRYAAELESKMGSEKTLKFIGGKLKRLDEEIAKLEKKHGNETNENKYIQQEEQLDALNRKKHALSSLIARAANAASEVQEVQEQAEIAQGKSVQGSNITNKYADAKKTYGNKETRTLADGTTLTGRWVVAEADAVTPSHDPFTQQPTDGYPTTADGNNINDNDYRGKGALVSQMANRYDARAIDNPVFIKDGVVVSGNNRTMSSIVAAKQGTDVKYREALAAKVHSFGISPESLNEFEHPRVFFEIEDDVPMTTEFMAKFNQRESKSKTPTERAIVASKRNNATLLAKLGVILDRFDSLAELYSNEAACTQVIFALQEAGIINQNEVPELMDAGSLTAAGKDFVEVFLLGASFSEKVIGILSKDGMKSYRAKIVKAILPIIENKQLNERSILSDITAAVIYIYQAKSVNLPLLDYITTGNMFEQIKWSIPALINAIKLLESEKSFREFVVLCNSILGEETPDMFTNEVITTDAFYSEYEKQLNDEQKKILHYARQVNGTTEAEATSGKQGDNVQSNHGNNDTAAEVSPAGSEREEREERQPRGEQQQSGVAEEAKEMAEKEAQYDNISIIKIDENVAQEEDDDADLRFKSENDVFSNETEEDQDATELAEKKKIAEDVQQKLGVEIILVDNASILPKETEAKAIKAIRKGRKILGWHNPTTNKTYLYVPNVTTPEDVEATILHEVVAHKGLRGLLGKTEFDNLCSRVFQDVMTPEERKKWIGYILNKKLKDVPVTELAELLLDEDMQRAAADEYMASIAEGGTDMNLWNKIKSVIAEFLRKIGFDVKLSDADVRSLLNKSRERLTAQRENIPVDPEVAKNIEIAEELPKSIEELTDQIAEEAGFIAKSINIPIKVITDINEVPQNRRDVMGWYENGQIVVVVPNHPSIEELYKTIMHEAVGHGGLRQLFGSDFNALLQNVITNTTPEIRAEIAALSRKHGWSMYEATEEYLSTLAEKQSFSNDERALWYKVKNAFNRLLSQFGLRTKITDNDLRYILQRSYDAVMGNNQSAIFDTARDVSLRRAYGINNKLTQEMMSQINDVRFRKANEVVFKSARDLYEAKMAEKLSKWEEGWLDSMNSLKIAQDAIAKQTGSPILPFEDAYMAENQKSSKNEAEKETYRRLHLIPMMESIKALQLAAGMSYYDDIKKYVFAKHGLERNTYMRQKAIEAEDATPREQAAAEVRDFSGLTALFNVDNIEEAEMQAQNYVDQVEGAAPTQTDDMWKAINAATKATLLKSYQSGLMTKENYEQIRDQFEYYIPLRGFKDVTAEEIYEYFDKSSVSSSFLPTIKTIKGRRTIADDPFATIATMAESAIQQGNNNLTKQRLLNMAINHPTSLLSINQMWYRNLGTEENPDWVAAAPDISVPGNITSPTLIAEHIAEQYRQFEQVMEELKEAGMATQTRTRLHIDYRTLRGQSLEHQVVVKQNGKEYVVLVNANPRLAQALNGTTNPDSDNRLLNAFKKMNRWLASNYTSRSPKFIYRNMMRDTIFSLFAISVKEDGAYNMRFRKNLLANYGRMASLVRKREKGKLNKRNEIEKLYDEFVTNGGETGYTRLLSVEDYKKQMQKYLNPTKGGVQVVKDVGGAIFGTIEFLNRSVESVARFAAYATSRQSGRKVEESVRDAKEVSVNFNKKGSGIKGQNYFSSLYMFFNAGVQGLVNFTKLAKNHPKKFWPRLAAWTIAGGLIPMINSLLAEALGGDDDEYMDLPEWIRRNNIVIGANGWYMTIPIAIELRCFYGIGEIAYSASMGRMKHKNIGLEIAAQFADLLPLNPLENASFSTMGGAITALAPDFMAPIMENAINRDFTGKPIYKKYDNNTNMPEYTKAYAGTNKALIRTSQLINNMTGGDAYSKGWADGWFTNPALTENLIEGYFGGMAQFVNEVAKTVSMAWDEDARQLRNVPIANIFLQHNDNITSSSYVNEMYYYYRDEAKIIQQRNRGYKRDGLPNTISPEEMRRYQIFQGGEKKIKKLNDKLKETTDPNQEKILRRKINSEKEALVDMLLLNDN